MSRPTLEQGTHEVLDWTLKAIGGLIPFDLAAVLRLDGDRLQVVHATGLLANERVRAHSVSLARSPTIRRALDLRTPIAVQEHQHAGEEGDTYDGVLDLPDGHGCMVVPLFAGEEDIGVLTLDRQVCGAYGPDTLALAGVYGQLAAMAIRYAEQAAVLARYKKQLERENRQLVRAAGGADVATSRLQGLPSNAMRHVVRVARQVARSDLPVLIQGETGSGKEVVAQALHAWSLRARGPMVTLNCAAIPDNLVESELFGHVRGAFSGAVGDRRGRFLSAHGGTLLLDEVGDLPLAAQSKLLRVLQEGVVEPVGADQPVEVDVRVLAATHVDLPKAVEEGRFREDLYYRLAVFPLEVPPLRERPEDVEIIAADVLRRETERSGRGPWTLAPAALKALQEAPWPGNVRQLVNALERATILQPAGQLELQHLMLVRARPPVKAMAPEGPFPTFQDNERRYLKAALERSGGKVYGVNGAAALVGLKPTTLQSRLRKLGLR